jgi:hypothetical protein
MNRSREPRREGIDATLAQIIAIAMILFFLCGMGYPDDAERVETRSTEIVIKVNPDIIVMPEGVYSASPGDVDIDSEEMRELNRKFNLIGIERMFAHKAPKGGGFPEREARAPDNEDAPDMENVFLFSFPEHIELGDILDEYGDLEEVIYAEKNKEARILKR